MISENSRLTSFKPTNEHFNRLLDMVMQMQKNSALASPYTLPHHIGVCRSQVLNQSMKGLRMELLEFVFNYDLPIDENHLQLRISSIQEAGQLPALQLHFVYQLGAAKTSVLLSNQPVFALTLTLGHHYLIAFTEDLTYELPLEMEQVLNLNIAESTHSLEALGSKIHLYCNQLIACKLPIGIRKNIYLESKVLGLLNFFFQHLNGSKQVVSQKRFVINEEDHPKLHLAKSILLAQLKAPITITELAKKVGLNENYLKRGFKELFQCTIHEFIQQERIENAKILLQLKGASVSQVGYDLGFSCVSHFSASFKKITGINPSELISSK